MAVVLVLTDVSTIQAQYSGGTGEPNDPYQIATAADLIALGETPEDYDKHFILTADLDLDPNLPDRKVFDKAVVAPDTDPNTEWDSEGTAFTRVFDGNGYTISHLTITGESHLGLFGQLGFSRDHIRNQESEFLADVSLILTSEATRGSGTNPRKSGIRGSVCGAHPTAVADSGPLSLLWVRQKPCVR